MINLIIWVMIFGGVFGILWWLNDKLPYPDPVKKVVRIVIMILAALLAINFLLSLVGHPIYKF